MNASVQIRRLRLVTAAMPLCRVIARAHANGTARRPVPFHRPAVGVCMAMAIASTQAHPLTVSVERLCQLLSSVGALLWRAGGARFHRSAGFSTRLVSDREAARFKRLRRWAPCAPSADDPSCCVRACELSRVGGAEVQRGLWGQSGPTRADSRAPRAECRSALTLGHGSTRATAGAGARVIFGCKQDCLA